MVSFAPNQLFVILSYSRLENFTEKQDEGGISQDLPWEAWVHLGDSILALFNALCSHKSNHPSF